MNPKAYIEGQTYKGVKYTEETPLPKGEYDNCVFQNCVFVNSDISDITFSDCQFIACDLSMANIKKTAFKTVKFHDSKLLGLRFELCNPFLLDLYFEKCTLNLSSFFSLKLKGTKFIHCHMHEVDLAGADLTYATFDHCDLYGSLFEYTILEKANLRTAFNFSIDPEQNRIEQAKFSAENIKGLLDRYRLDID